MPAAAPGVRLRGVVNPDPDILRPAAVIRAWVAQLAATSDSLNRAIIEKDALRDLQKSEIEHQIQMRQNAWSDRITVLRQELDDQRADAGSLPT